MNWFPYERCVFPSSLPLDELKRRLGAVIEPKKWLRFQGADRFQGTFDGERFVVMRIIGYRNSWLPVVEGQLRSAPGGSELAVTLRLHRFVAAFMLVWFGGALTFGVLFPWLVWRGGMKDAWGAVIPWGMLAFGWALSVFAFSFEAAKAKRILADVTKGP